MGKRKRRHSEDSNEADLEDSDESEKSINWAKKYLEKDKLYVEMINQKDETIKQKDEKINEKDETIKATAKELKELNEKLETALRLNAEIRVKNNELESDLAVANTEYLKMKQALSAKGAIELLESVKFKAAPSNCKTRAEKYEWLLKTSNTFRENVKNYVNREMSGKELGYLARDLYASASHDIHTSFDYKSEVVVYKKNYQKEQLKLLEAICHTLNVPLKKL